ncbi:MAG: AraC family transcriptional regulator [Paenibacillaceae bacterium]|nr:AraC family transcriptional regulator [Paenibacillaceae bacterium]
MNKATNETPQRYPLRRKAEYGELAPSIHWAQVHSRSPDEIVAMRRIYDFELLYVLQGEADVSIAGASHVAQAGSLVYLPSGVPHRVQVTSAPCARFLGVHFDYFDDLDVQADEDIIVNEQQLQPEHYCAEPLLPDADAFFDAHVRLTDPQAASLMEFIIREFNERKEGFEIVCKGVLLQLFALLRRSRAEERRQPHPKYGEPVLQLVREMENDITQPWPVKRIAARLNVELSYAAKLFKGVTGMTPSRYIQYVRHQEAKRLLRETELKIEAVGRHVGYDDLHYFSRIFHKWEGMSANRYRRLSQIF